MKATGIKSNCMIKALVIDDEESAINVIKILVQKYIPEITSIATALGPEDGITKISELNPDLVFLDIQMPGMTGFELLEKFSSQYNFEVIFITAYDQYAIKAIRFSAIDYLLKPIAIEDLKNAVQRYLNKKADHTEMKSRMNNFLKNIRSENEKDFKLALPTHKGTFFLRIDEIIRCQADVNYTHFHLTNKANMISSKTLKEYDELLSEHDFLRVHKSHLVNRKYIRSILQDNVLLMDDNSQVEVSRRKTAEIKNLLLERK